MVDHHFSDAQIKALYLCPMITGSISLIGSSTISVMILKSPDQLSTPFRRLIFGLSVADVIQSLAMVLGPFSLPKDMDGVLWSNGNRTTCDIQGFALHVGFAGVPMYMLSLSVYYLCAVKYNRSDKHFSRKIEPWLHIVSIAWTLAGGIACLLSGSFNIMRSGNICWYTPLPYDCVTNDAVECIRGELAFTFGWIFGGSNAITLGGIIYCLVGVCRTVVNQEKRNDRYRFSGSIAAADHPSDCLNRSSISRRLSSVVSSLRHSLVSSQIDQTSSDVIAASTSIRQSVYVTRIIERSERRKAETMKQASLYVLAFIWTCIWAYLYGFLVTVGLNVPYAIIFLFSLFYPLGGFFNILVYTRPKINTLRKRHADLKWSKAFVEVLKAGGEVPSHLSVAKSSKSGNENGSSMQNVQNSSRRMISSLRNSSFEEKDIQRRKSSMMSDKSEDWHGNSGNAQNEESKQEIRATLRTWRSLLPHEVSSSQRVDAGTDLLLEQTAQKDSKSDGEDGDIESNPARTVIPGASHEELTAIGGNAFKGVGETEECCEIELRRDDDVDNTHKDLDSKSNGLKWTKSAEFETFLLHDFKSNGDKQDANELESPRQEEFLP